MATLDHVALAVSDPARSLSFYRDTLGVEGQVSEEPYGFVIHTPTGVAFTLFGGQAPAPVGDFHVGVSLPDGGAVHAARRRFASTGLVEREWEEEPGRVSVKVLDPDGYLVEVFWDAETETPPSTG